MQIATERQDRIFWPLSTVFLVVIGSFFLGSLVASDKMYLLYVCVIIFGVIIFIKPVFGLLLLPIFDFWLGGLQFIGANPRTFTIAFLFLVLLVKRRKIRITNEYKVLFIVILLLITWMLIINIKWFSQESFYESVRMCTTLLVLSSLPILFPLVLRNTRNLERYSIWFLAVISISGVVALLQSIGVPFFYYVRESINKSVLFVENRPLGLSFSHITFSYEVYWAIVLLFPLYFYFKSNASRKRYYILGLLAINILALLMNKTVSAFFAVAIFLIIFSYGLKIRYLIPIVVIIFTVLLSYLGGDYRFLRFTHLPERLINTRFARFEVAFDFIRNHPLGIGSYRQYGEYLWREGSMNLNRMQGISYYSYSVHNHPLMVLVISGIPGFSLFLFFVYSCFKTCSNRSTSDLTNFLNLGFASGMIAYLVHTSFHNAGPVRGDNFFWYVVGIYFCALAIAHKRAKCG